MQRIETSKHIGKHILQRIETLKHTRSHKKKMKLGFKPTTIPLNPYSNFNVHHS